MRPGSPRPCRRRLYLLEVEGGRAYPSPPGTAEAVPVNTGRSQRRANLDRRLSRECPREDCSGDGQADRAADLAEEDQVACRHPQLLPRHGVLDDDREDRQRWADAEAGDELPDVQDRRRRVRAQVGHQVQTTGDGEQGDHRQPLVVARAADVLAAQDRAEDQSGQERQELIARFRRR